jgi:hypothetical protein
LEKVVTSPTYDPTSRPAEPGVEQPDPRLEDAGQTGTFADSELEYAPTEGGREQYGERGGSDMGSSSTMDTAKSEAANVKDTAVDAAAGVKDVAKGEASNVAQEAKYQARSLMDQTRSTLRGQQPAVGVCREAERMGVRAWLDGLEGRRIRPDERSCSRGVSPRWRDFPLARQS